MSDDNKPADVTRLPVKFKEQAPPDRTLVAPWEVNRRGGCDHLYAGYVVSRAEADVECGRCGAKLNPMWVLEQLAVYDRRMAAAQERYRDEMQRLAERERTKCQHCNRMTRISRR